MKKTLIIISVCCLLVLLSAWTILEKKRNQLHHEFHGQATSSPMTNEDGTSTNTRDSRVFVERYISGNKDTPEQIIVYADAVVGKRDPLIGFIHGVTYDPTIDYSKTIELLSALNPQSWRIGNESNDVYGFVVQKANFPQKIGTKIVFNIQSAFNQRYGYTIRISKDCMQGDTNINFRRGESACYKTFQEAQRAWKDTVERVMIQKAKRSLTIDEFEIFAEPTAKNLPLMEGLTHEQILILYKDANNIIRDHEPNAIIGGPSLISFVPQLQEGFLDYIIAEGIRLDYVAWHEFQDPQDVVVHALDNRKMLQERPKLCDPSCPKVVIGEFAPPEHYHIPGINLAWFYYLEKAEVDEANRACFKIQSPKDTCWMAFNGVLMGDNKTTTDLYWVYKLYADMNHLEVRTWISQSRTVAIADRDDAKKEISILAGRYGYKGVAEDVHITVKDYPFSNKTVNAEILKIPMTGTLYHLTPLAEPLKIETQTVPVTDGTIELNIGSFEDGEVYHIRLKQTPS